MFESVSGRYDSTPAQFDRTAVANGLLSDSHPLVVRLPCHKDHLFDLECIQPWLKLNPTCPLDRQTLIKKKPPPPPLDEEDGEYDDMFA